MGVIIVIIAIIAVVVIVIIVINIQLPYKCYSKPAVVEQHGNHNLGTTQQTNIQPQASVKYKLTCQNFIFTLR